MRLPLFLISSFLILAFSAPTYLFLNDYDGTGYLISDGITRFPFQGECGSFLGRVKGVFIPPDRDVDVYGEFPKEKLLIVDGMTMGVEEGDVKLPKEVLRRLNDATIVCFNAPVRILDFQRVQVMATMTALELGNAVRDTIGRVTSWELPLKWIFAKGEVVNLQPRPPKVSLEVARLEGVGAVLIPKVEDFSRVEIFWRSEGTEREGRVFGVGPGEHEVELRVVDELGLESRVSTKVRVEPFREVVKRIEYEIGSASLTIDGGALDLRKPGIYVFEDLRPCCRIVHVVEATDTLSPMLTLYKEDGKLKWWAEDENGVSVYVYRSGVAREGVAVVAVDRFGNTTMESTSLERFEDVRKILNLRSPFMMGWGR